MSLFDPYARLRLHFVLHFMQQSDVEILSRPSTVGFYVRAMEYGWDATFPIITGDSCATAFAGSDSTKPALVVRLFIRLFTSAEEDM